MSSLKNWELERAYHELEFLGRDCGGLSGLTEWRTNNPYGRHSTKFTINSRAQDSANGSEGAPSFMKVE